MNKIPSADRFRRRAGFLWSGEGLTGTIFVRFCPIFAEKCRISVVEKSVGNDLFQCLYILCVFYINNINVILL